MAKKLPPVRLKDVKAGAVPATAASPGRQTARPEGDAQLSVMLPAGVVRQVKARAVEHGETLRVAVLRALSADGYDIAEEDMVDRRIETARLKAELLRRHRAGEG